MWEKGLFFFIVFFSLTSSALCAVDHCTVQIKDVEIAVGTRKGNQGYGLDRRKADVTIKWKNNSGKIIKSTLFKFGIRKNAGLLSIREFCTFELKSNKKMKIGQAVSQRWDDLLCSVFDWPHLSYRVDNVEITFSDGSVITHASNEFIECIDERGK
jgi:hypothetical protein